MELGSDEAPTNNNIRTLQTEAERRVVVQHPMKTDSEKTTYAPQERLNGLALPYVHRDMPLNYDAVIDEFSPGNQRPAFTSRK